MSRLTTVDSIVAIIAARAALNGSADATPGTWPELHGPTVTAWADPHILGDKQTCIFVEEIAGTVINPSITGASYDDDYTVTLRGYVGEHSPDTSTTRTLATTMFDEIIAALHSSSMRALTPSIELDGSCDGPNRFASESGVWAEMSFTLRIQEYVNT